MTGKGSEWEGKNGGNRGPTSKGQGCEGRKCGNERGGRKKGREEPALPIKNCSLALVCEYAFQRSSYFKQLL